MSRTPVGRMHFRCSGGKPLRQTMLEIHFRAVKHAQQIEPRCWLRVAIGDLFPFCDTAPRLRPLKPN